MLDRYLATVVLPHPAGPVTINRCLCRKLGLKFRMLDILLDEAERGSLDSGAAA